MASIYSIKNGSALVWEMGNRKAIKSKGSHTQYFVRKNSSAEWCNAYAVFADAFIAKVERVLT